MQEGIFSLIYYHLLSNFSLVKDGFALPVLLTKIKGVIKNFKTCSVAHKWGFAQQCACSKCKL